MKHSNFITITLALVTFLFWSCETQSTSSSQAEEAVVEDTVNNPIDPETEKEDLEPVKEEANSTNKYTSITNEKDFSSPSKPTSYVGYIGKYKVAADIDFFYDQMWVSGYYNYGEEKKENRLRLKGKQTDWYGGGIYTIEEYDDKGNITGLWKYMRENHEGAYKGSFESTDGKTTYEITLVKEESGMFIDPNTHMCFDSKSAADTFYSDHHFFDRTSAFRTQGLIVCDKTYGEDGPSPRLPEGLTLFQHDGGDGFSLEKAGKVDAQGTFVLTFNNKPIENYEVESREIGYEIEAVEYSSLPDEKYACLNGIGIESIYVSIEELKSFGYHLEGDGYWLKEHSGKVLGYFPSSKFKNDKRVLAQLEIKKEPNETSSTLVIVKDDEDGFIRVLDFKNGWLHVRLDYHTEVPCTSEKRAPKASVEGWIPMYITDEDYKSYLTLGFYSRGC